MVPGVARALVCIAVSCVASARAQGPDGDLSHRLETQRITLRQVEGDLAAAQADAESLRASERDIAGRLVDATNRAGMIEHAIARLVYAESLLAHDIAEAQARACTLRAEIAGRQKIMERRVRVLYMQGRRHPYQRALLASSLTHWLAARQYLATLNRRDLIDVQHLRADRARVDSLMVLQQMQRETLDSLIVRKREERRRLVEAERETRRLLGRVRGNRHLMERAAAELEGQRRASEARIAEYLAAQAWAGAQAGRNPLVGDVSTLAPVDFGEEKGRLPWPVEGRVVSTFGRRRDQITRTWTRNRGIDISAPKGTEVLAVASGEVVMVDWFRGYGSFLIVSHGRGYYTLYAHLDLVTVRRGDQVRQGQVIGVSGNGGTFGATNVHFELLAGHDALNPLEWLLPRAQGSS